jgi:hypothetical protein
MHVVASSPDVSCRRQDGGAANSLSGGVGNAPPPLTPPRSWRQKRPRPPPRWLCGVLAVARDAEATFAAHAAAEEDAGLSSPPTPLLTARRPSAGWSDAPAVVCVVLCDAPEPALPTARAAAEGLSLHSSRSLWSRATLYTADDF